MILDTDLGRWAALEHKIVRVIVTLPTGRTLADWDSFVLTLREDPLYLHRSKQQLETADPHGEAWVIKSQVTGEIDEDVANMLVFDIASLPAFPGTNRYAMDVRGVGGVAAPDSETSLYPSTWVDLQPAVK